VAQEPKAVQDLTSFTQKHIIEGHDEKYMSKVSQKGSEFLFNRKKVENSSSQLLTDFIFW
jgi:hypothetical protein